MTKLNVGVIFGGASAEHEVSKLSAVNVLSYLNSGKYNIIPIYVSKDGTWYLYDGNFAKLPENIEKYCATVTLGKQGILRIVGDKVRVLNVDIVFSVIHGKQGEDGTIQGLCEVMGLPYVGSGVLASSICMDKTYTNLVASSFNIPTVPSIVLTEKYLQSLQSLDEVVKEIKSKLGYPCFIKPASSGSSIGTFKVKNKKEIITAIDEALKIDNKIIVQKFIKCRELECAVLEEDDGLIVTPPGEIQTTDEFYSYEAKYISNESKTIVPAKVSEEVVNTIRDYAQILFNATLCKGLARIDFFLDQTGNIIFNEINTMPGFTDISMYPKLLNHVGYSGEVIVSKLIQNAVFKQR